MDSEQVAGDETQQPQLDERGLLGFSLQYPSRGGWETILVGAIVLLFFWLVVPLFIVAGYFVRLTRAAGRGDADPPEFTDWSGLGVEGGKLLLVLVPGGIVYVLAIVLTSEVSEILGFIVAIAGFYVWPSIYMNYAVTGNWKTAYTPSVHAGHITTKTYLYGFLLNMFVINGIGQIVATILFAASLLTIIGWIIIWPMIYFYWYGIDAAIWGRVYNRIEMA